MKSNGQEMEPDDSAEQIRSAPDSLTDTKVTNGSLRRYQKFMHLRLELPCEVTKVGGADATPYVLNEVTHEMGDTFYGLIGVTKDARGKFRHIPLSDLVVVDQSSENYDLVVEYTNWFVDNQ